jgi:ATP-dependent DNA ligase
MVAFDPLYLNGYEVRKLPLRTQGLLKKIIAKADIQSSKSFEVKGR